MTGKKYREALARAAQSARAERGYKSTAALIRETDVSSSTAYRVEGSKNPDQDLMLATIEEYADAVGIHLGELLSRADQIYTRDIDVVVDFPSNPSETAVTVDLSQEQSAANPERRDPGTGSENA